MTKLTRLEVENYKRLIAVDIKLGEHVTEISGANGAGKSSAIDAAAVLLQGLAVAPAVPIRRGAEECVIRGSLGDLIVERKFRTTADGKVSSSVTLRTPEGAKYPSPQKHLDELIGQHMLDPLDFVNMAPKAQFDVLRRFVPNVDFEAIDRLNQGDYDKRTDVNRRAKDARAAASTIMVPDGTPDKPTDETELVAQLEDAGKQNTETEQRKARRERVTRDITDLRARADGAKSAIETFTAERHARCAERVDEWLRQMEELKRKIEAEKKATDEECRANAERRAVESVNLTVEADELQAKLDCAEPLPDAVDTVALREQIEAARIANKNVALKQQRAEWLKKAAAAEKEAKALTEAMEARTADKQVAIAKAQLPIEGLGFGEGCITLHGIPFEQSSTAEKYRTAFGLIAALHPKVRLAWIRDASLLDDNSLQIVDRLSKEYDCQVLLETVRATNKNAIVLEDGRIKQAQDQAA
jgi:hypothetical protein